MRSESDLTQRLVVHHWMHSTSGYDCTLLGSLIDRVYPPTEFISRTQATIDATYVLFRAVQKGSGSYSQFLAKFEAAFIHYGGSDAEAALILFASLYSLSLHHTPPHPEQERQPGFLRTLIKSTSLYRSISLLLTRAVQSHASWGTSDTISVLEAALYLLKISLDGVVALFRAESGGLVRIFARVGMLDALDVAVPLFAKHKPRETLGTSFKTGFSSVLKYPLD